MQSIREIYKIGKGPSSSHTMGPERAARIFKAEHPDADQYRVSLYGSLSKTGKGHGTDRVLYEVLAPAKVEVLFSDEIPEGMTHPNTLDFFALKEGKEIGRMRAASIGGGDIRILDLSVDTPCRITLSVPRSQADAWRAFLQELG